MNFQIITGLRLGSNGAIFEKKTTEFYVPREIFTDNYEIDRIGCRIILFHIRSSNKAFYHFQNVQDAINLMNWLAGFKAMGSIPSLKRGER
jgi:hypothetical protein